MAIDALHDACDFVDVLALPSFVLSCDEDGEIRFQHFNPAHVAAIGIPSANVRGKTPRECFPARVADTLLNNYATCHRTGKPYEYEELLDLGGEEMWWHTMLSPVIESCGNMIGIIGIALDISEHKAKEFRRAEAESALRELNEEIALFTSMTAHDVRGPLNKIAALSELTLDGFADLGDNKRDMIVSMRKVASGALRHVDGILGYARALRLGEVETTTIDLGHMCRDIAAVIDPEARLSISSPDLFISGERAVLQLILRNLAENATRHAKTRLGIAVAEAGNGRVYFSVSDDGPGFDGGAEAFAEKLRMRHIRQGNRGFGLVAVAHLVESRDGRIWLDPPSFGTGATISFDVPGRIIREMQREIAPRAAHIASFR